jgi:hypothetical protein
MDKNISIGAYMNIVNGSFTLAIFSMISCVISQPLSHLFFLPWPIEMILSLSRRPRWPMQVQYVLLLPALS